MEEKVKEAISKIRPVLGGTDVTLVSIEDGVVKVKVLQSSCHPGIGDDMVLEMLEDQLKEDLPEIREVVAIEA